METRFSQPDHSGHSGSQSGVKTRIYSGVRAPWIDYLRGFITLLVVAHHSSLAYTTFAHFNKDAYILSTHPVVDTVRSRGLDLFEDFNDIFFMSLMFLISGIFVIKSIGHKGRIQFIRDRFYRLLIPFAIGVTVLMLLAYYPAYLLAHGKNDIGGYIKDFFTVEAWPVGPPWFIWVLFFFNLLFAILYPLLHSSIRHAGTFLAGWQQRPIRLILLWFSVTWILYIPAMLLAGPDSWTGIGPFDFQISRVLLYFGYFILGIVIGSPGLTQGIFADGSKFVEKWPAWIASCIFAYALLKLSEPPLRQLIDQHRLSLLQATLLHRSLWVLSCTLSCIAFLTSFKALFSTSGPRTRTWWDSLAANAYGIYLIHYIFVIWCQYFLLDFSFLPAVVKFLITFGLSFLVSWWVTSKIRQIDLFRRYL